MQIPKTFVSLFVIEIPKYSSMLLFFRLPISKPSVLSKFSFGPATFENYFIVFILYETD